MTVLETIVVAFSMFSAIPMPRVEWNDKNMRYALCAFPLVGLAAGILMALWVWLSLFLGLPGLLRAAGLTAIPVLLTGGIHLDGYADTQDALASHRSPAERQEILKDPHTGAFAVIRLCLYFLLSFALWGSLRGYPPLKIALMLLLSRSLSGLAVAAFPLARGSGLAYTFHQAADKRKVAWMLGVLSVLLGLGLCLRGLPGVLMALGAAGTFGYYHRMAKKQFGGLSGDLAGWFLQTAELIMLLALCLGQYLEVLI